MNGLEAIELMKQGKVVVRVDTRVQYRLNNDRVEGADHIGRWSDSWMFSVNSEYEECIEPKPLTGWDRTEHWEDAEGFYSIAECDVLADRTSYNHVLNQRQKKSTSNKRYSVSYNVSVMKMVGMRLIGRIPTKKSTVFYIATVLKNCSPILLGFAKIKDKFISFQKKSQKKQSNYSMMI